MDKQYKAKIGNLVSGDVLDSLKNMNNSFSSNEENMFDNNLVAPSKGTENIINVSGSHTNEEEYVDVLNKVKRKSFIYRIFLIFLPIIISIAGILACVFERVANLGHCIFFISLLSFVLLTLGFILFNDIKKHLLKSFYDLANEKRIDFGKEVDKERLKVSGEFNNPIVVGFHDELFLYLEALCNAQDGSIHNIPESFGNVLKNIVEYNIMGKVQFDGKETWIPENEKVKERAIYYGYNNPNYVVTNNAINVFIDDDGISEMLFENIEKHNNFIIPKNMLKENPNMQNVIKVLCLMNVLSKKKSNLIEEEIIEFGPRYEAYRAYMKSRS